MNNYGINQSQQQPPLEEILRQQQFQQQLQQQQQLQFQQQQQQHQFNLNNNNAGNFNMISPLVNNTGIGYSSPMPMNNVPNGNINSNNNLPLIDNNLVFNNFQQQHQQQQLYIPQQQQQHLLNSNINMNNNTPLPIISTPQSNTNNIPQHLSPSSSLVQQTPNSTTNIPPQQQRVNGAVPTSNTNGYNNVQENDSDDSDDDSEEEQQPQQQQQPLTDEEEEEEEEEEENSQSESDYQSDEDDSEEDNDSYFKKAKNQTIVHQQQQNKRSTRGGGGIKYLSDESEEEEESSDSDYEPNKRKGKKKKAIKKKKTTKKKKNVSKMDLELETLATTLRSTRERRSTVRLFSELQGNDNSTNEDDNDDDDDDQDENSGDDYQSDSETTTITHNGDVNMNNMYDDDDDSEDYQDDSDDYSTKRKRSKNKKQFESNTITHSNLRKRGDQVDFSIFNSDEDEYEEGQKQQQETVVQNLVVEAPLDGDTIEKVIDHRLKSKPTTESTDSNNNNDDETEKKEEIDELSLDSYEFLIKWKGWAHIHNTWDSYNQLIHFAGNKKLVNYSNSVLELVTWRQDASREDIEQADIQKELYKQEYSNYLKVERIIASREVEPNQDTQSTIQYLVKWHTLPYCDVTWEYPEEISDKYQNEIDNFLIRQQIQQKTKDHSVSAKKRSEIGFTKLEKQPDYLSAGTLRDYQMEGLNWLAHSWFNNTNVILADEMGLGKTIQTISFLSYLNVEQQMPGPFLVVVPLSTIENWQREFTKWAPQLNVILYTGTSPSRTIIREYEFFSYSKSGKRKINFNVLLTTYDFILKDKMILGQLKWDYLAVDEAHRLKNADSILHEVLKSYHTGNRLLVTGTPLQNSLKELWNLLNFLMPNKFHSLKEFQDQYSDLKEKEQIGELHRVLKPHLLRRIKKDVEKSLPPKTERILRVDFTPLQKRYYKWILAKNFNELNKGVKGEKTTLLNIVTELKKTCNHPYLFESAVQESSGTLDDMIKGSGKLILLDKLLIRLKETGHRVLIFSQMVRMLDILAEYLKKRSFQFQRLDGSMGNDKRTQAMDRFNAKDSPDFCFLLSTRAGGLGINLTTADTVIIFDSDWNPQNDLQAEARAHRIGQKNHVNIYRLVSKGSIEEDILERAKQKMVLDHLVIQTMEKSATASKSSSSVFNKEDLEKILKFGAEDLFKEGDDDANAMPEMDIDEILSRAETKDTTAEGNPNDMSAGQELLNSFRVANFTSKDSAKEDLSWDQIIPDSERKNIPAEEDPLLLLGTRRSRQEQASTINNMPQLNNSKTITVKPKKEITFFNKKETKDLIRSLKKFGTHQRSKEILKDASFPSVKPVRATEDICKEIIDACRKAVRDNQDSDKVHIVYNGTDINANEMMQRVLDMEVLSDLCRPYLDKHQDFRVTFPIRPVSWQVKWGPKEDAMVLMGSYKWGLGNWEAIQQDQTLGLSEMISISNEDQSTKVKGATLQRRVDSLLKSARDRYLSKKSQSSNQDKETVNDQEVKSTRPNQRKRVPRTSNSGNGVTVVESSKKLLPEKRKLSKYSDDEDDIQVDDDDDDDDYQEKPIKKKLRSSSSTGQRGRPSLSTSKPKAGSRQSTPSKSSVVSAQIQSPVRTSSGRMSVPPQKLNQVSSPLKSSSLTTTTTTTTSSGSKPLTKSSLLSDDDNNHVERRGRPSRTTTTTTTSSSEVKKRCDQLLNSSLPLLMKFKSLSDSQRVISREDKLAKTKKYLLKLGDEIEILSNSEKLNNNNKLPTITSKNLWEHSSKYTASSGDDLRALYEKMKKNNNNNNNSKPTPKSSSRK